MPAARRPQLDDRRRLVIYSQRFAEDSPAQSKRGQAADAALRCARKPAAAYGWRVQRRLRARWFSMVPVRRRTLCGVLGAIAAMVMILALGHWAALWWVPLAQRPDLARSLRLDRPDSLGTWFSAALMATTAASALLVYQLRRYRTDDYRGHYRLWPVAIVISLLASIDAVSDLVGWFGAAVDVALAERDVLAGADWVRLLLAVGGAAFGLRLLGELSRCRTAAISAVLALGLLGVAPAVRWNLLRLEPAASLTWVPIALLAGRAVLLGTVVIYLRMLYREVRNLNSGVRLRDRLRERLRSLLHRRRTQPEASQSTPAPTSRSRSGPVAKVAPANPSERRGDVTNAEDDDALDEQTDVAAASRDGDARQNGKRKPRFALWRRPSNDGTADAVEKADCDAGESGDELDRDSQEEVRRGRRKFSLPFSRRRGSGSEDASASDGTSGDVDANETQMEVKRERRKIAFPFGRQRARDAAENKSDIDESSGGSDGHEARDEAKRERRRFALPFGRRRAVAADSEEESGDASQDQPRASAASRRPSSAPPPAASLEEPDGEDVDPDTIDWDSLNKSERRRARKLLKRQGKAA